jgi:uncharacterized membrane protein
VNGTYKEARGGTDATVELEYELPMGMFAGVAEKLLGGSIERDLRHSMENFKALCESTIPATSEPRLRDRGGGSLDPPQSPCQRRRRLRRTE